MQEQKVKIPQRYYRFIAVLIGFGLLACCTIWYVFCQSEMLEGEALNEQAEDSLYNHGLLAVKMGEKWGYLDKKGDMRILPQFDEANAFAKDGLALVKKDEKYGMIDNEGNIVIPLQFDDLREFSPNGLALAKIDNQYGYINRLGNFVIAPQYQYATNFTAGGRAAIEQNNKWGIINQSGELILSPQFDTIGKLNDNGLTIVRVDANFGLIDETGKIIAEPKYEDILLSETGQLAWIGKQGVYQKINKMGEVVFQQNIPQITQYHTDSDLLVAQRDAIFFLYDGKGNLLSDKYDFYHILDNGLILIMEKGRVGFLNTDAKLVIAPQFTEADNFYEGLCCTKKAEQWGAIDKRGRVIIPYLYDSIGNCHNGMLSFYKDGKAGFLYADGTVAIDAQYTEVSDFYGDGYAIVMRDNKYGVINRQGELIVPLEYDLIKN